MELASSPSTFFSPDKQTRHDNRMRFPLLGIEAEADIYRRNIYSEEGRIDVWERRFKPKKMR
jgi:hypothetical protein